MNVITKLNIQKVKKGLSLNEIALLSGYSISHIKKIFCGIRVPSKEVANHLIRVMK